MKKWFYRIGMLLIAISMCITTPFLFEILCGTFLFTIHFKQKEKIEKRLLGSTIVAYLVSIVTFAVCYASDLWIIRNVLYAVVCVFFACYFYLF